jgi:hypothetical protein
MTRIKLAGLCLVAVFAFSAVAVAQASAAAEYTYHVEGKELAKGATKEVKASMKSKNFVLKGKGTLEVESVTTCTSLKLAAGGLIVGGKPGKSEKEKIEFGGCTATVGGSKCEKVEVENVLTSNEIVTVKKPASLEGDLAVLFTPGSGEVFSKIKFTKCGFIFGSPKAEITGSVAALVASPKTEAVSGALQYKVGETEITEVTNSEGKSKTVGLFNEKTKKATIEGEANVELVSGEKYGVF